MILKDKREFIEFEIESLAIRHFMIVYDKLDKELKSYFLKNINKLSYECRELLYFAYAGIQGNKFKLNVNPLSIDSSSFKYKKDENFTDFTVKQIVTFQRNHNILPDLNFNITSFNTKTVLYRFTDCYTKLNNMRNKLAHEMGNLTITDKDFIEIISDDYINENASECFGDLDISQMTYEAKSIFSNILFTRKMLDGLGELATKNETMDS